MTNAFGRGINYDSISTQYPCPGCVRLLLRPENAPMLAGEEQFRTPFADEIGPARNDRPPIGAPPAQQSKQGAARTRERLDADERGNRGDT